MAHYAFLNDENLVTEVIVGHDENVVIDGISSWEEYYGNIRQQVCKRTSYNTVGNKHLLGGEPFRYNYAGVGFTYDSVKDAFIPPKPYESWSLNEETCLWEAPIPFPNDGAAYAWDEDSLNWILIEGE